MPINVLDNLPAVKVLNNENIFVMTETRAYHQDIRPLKIVILNLMPKKVISETQLLRLIGNTPIQVDITLMHPVTHLSKNTPAEYLIKFYNIFDDIKDQKFDGMIITGAPVEQLPFEQVDYWDELRYIMDWSLKNVYSTLFICWGAQAGLYHYFGVPKYELSKKMFGVFTHTVEDPYEPIFRGFDDEFFIPHSRYTEVREEDIKKIPSLRLLSKSEEAGVFMTFARGGRQIFMTGHPEYDVDTLKLEYERDRAKGLEIELPRNYFPEDSTKNSPKNTWRAHANLLFTNWLNYYVYQQTPYDLNIIGTLD